MQFLDEHGEVIATDTFTQVCYECDPPRTVNYLNGERVPSPCEHDLPAVVIEGYCP